MNSPSASMTAADATNPTDAPASQPPDGASSKLQRGPAAAPQPAATAQAQQPTAAQAIAELWADLDAHARLRQAREASAAMQSRQRFD